MNEVPYVYLLCQSRWWGITSFFVPDYCFYLIYTYQEFNIQAEIDGTISGSSEYYEVEREEYDNVIWN